jgi:hypothetical protein
LTRVYLCILHPRRRSREREQATDVPRDDFLANLLYLTVYSLRVGISLSLLSDSIFDTSQSYGALPYQTQLDERKSVANLCQVVTENTQRKECVWLIWAGTVRPGLSLRHLIKCFVLVLPGIESQIAQTLEYNRQAGAGRRCIQ